MLNGTFSRMLRRTVLTAAITLLAVVSAACGALGQQRTYLPDTEAAAVTVNIEVDAKGYHPSEIRVPAGPSIQLIFRNRTKEEYHYRVTGLLATQLLWLAPKADMTREDGVSDDEHEAHHAKDFVDWRAKSPAGIKPTLTEVHAYSAGIGVDVVHFYALQPGTYKVSDPLHPDLKGTFTVYAR